MNIEPLFKRFDELADAPERIPALRKVILAYLLHSAVNSPDAISRAVALREAHEVRRRELIKNASRKDVPTVPQVTDADLPPSLSDIPTALFDRLGNISSIEKGLSQIQSTSPGKYPLVVTAETRSSSEAFDFEGAAAIIPLVSSTGHGDASLKRIHYQEGRYAVGNILAVVKPICPDLLRARFIYEYLSAFKEELLVSRMVGTANVSLTVSKLKEVPVPLVSGPVLTRIDELMALCDRLALQQQERETRHAALARASLARFAEAPAAGNLHYLFHDSVPIPPADLRKAILTLAVQGKLVPHDANDESAEADFNSLVSARENSPLKRTKIDEEVTAADPLIPASWMGVSLGELVSIRTGFAFKSGDYASQGTFILRVTNINPDGSFDTSNAVFLPDAKLDDKMQGFLLEEHELLVVMVGGSLGKIGQVTAEILPALLNQNMWRLKPYSDHLEYRFLRLVLRDLNENRLQVTASTHGHLAMGTYAAAKVPFPPLAEQRRIVAKVEQLMALVDALETQLAAGRVTGEKLLVALVAKLTNPQEKPATSRHVMEPRKYFIQFVAALLGNMHRPIFLHELTRTIAFLFLPNRLLPLAEGVGGVPARRHFENFPQANADGALAEALKVLHRVGAISYLREGQEYVLKFHPVKSPPIDPLIEKDGKYMADILNILPTDDSIPSEETQAQQLARELLAVM